MRIDYDPAGDEILNPMGCPAETSEEMYKVLVHPEVQAEEPFRPIKPALSDSAILGDFTVAPTQLSKQENRWSVAKLLASGVRMNKLAEAINECYSHAERGEDAYLEHGIKCIGHAEGIPKSKWSVELFEACISFLFLLTTAHMDDDDYEYWMSEIVKIAKDCQRNHPYDEIGFYWHARVLFQDNSKRDEAVELLKTTILEKRIEVGGGSRKIPCPRCCKLMVE